MDPGPGGVLVAQALRPAGRGLRTAQLVCQHLGAAPVRLGDTASPLGSPLWFRGGPETLTQSPSPRTLSRNSGFCPARVAQGLSIDL